MYGLIIEGHILTHSLQLSMITESVVIIQLLSFKTYKNRLP